MVMMQMNEYAFVERVDAKVKAVVEREISQYLATASTSLPAARLLGDEVK